jgi:hypothetical protein
MTERNPIPLSFSSPDRRRVEADFSAGALTTDAGALLPREADRRLGLLDALDEAIPDPRNPALITHPQRALLAQRVFGIALGYEDLNDHSTLRDDPLWQLLAEYQPGAERPLASAPTLCRLENRVARRALFDMAEALVEQFVSSFAEPPESLVLDFDATDDPVHGRQEGRSFHGYYDNYCFLPLYVFCGDRLPVAYLRTADADAARHAQAIPKPLVRRFRQAWPEVRVIVRGASGFCRWRLMQWCDGNGIGHIFGPARNSRVERLALPWTHAAATCWGMTHQPQRPFGEFSYRAEKWDRARRAIVEAGHAAKGDNPRFAVSNLPGNPRGLYEVPYCARGEMGNRIEEQQLMPFADRTGCRDFLANQFRLPLGAAAYVPVEAVRRLGLVGTQLERARVSTIRLRLFEVAALVVVSVRRVVLRLASGFPPQELFGQVLRRLRGGNDPRGGVAAEGG